MNHKKEEHTKKVKSCWHFSAGFCPFGDQKCWFAHSTENDIPLSNEYACSFCDKVCRSQSDLLHHRKKKHEKHVSSCAKFKMESVFMERRIAGSFIMSKKIFLKKILM